MKNIFVFIGLFLMSLSCVSMSHSSADKYQCSMKCEDEKVYDKPGKCPVCRMELKLVAGTSGSDHRVRDIGTMMNTMHKNQLAGVISLDTISNREHLFGLGPVEYLTGEILIRDGKTLVSSVAADGSIKIEETSKVKAPFFVYANVSQWIEKTLPEEIQTLTQLSAFLNESTLGHTRPFAFRLTAQLEDGDIHIVNLPKQNTVHSPEDAHQGQKSFLLKNEKVELIGFFSTEHKGIYIHHDSYVHVHLLSDDGKKMGHLDGMTIKKGSAKLYLPAE